MLRPYQSEALAGIESAWVAGAVDVLAVLPTGAGKTVLFCELIRRRAVPTVAIAHRSELVAQMSLALARNGVRHRVIGSKPTREACAQVHALELGAAWIDPRSPVAVASVDTLIRHDPADAWLRQVRLVVQDEAHHLLTGNKWGKARAMFPGALGLGVTATPCRADGKGLGRHADGVFDVMVLGPTMRDLMSGGYLCDYRIFAPPSDLDLSAVPTSAGGDFSPGPLSAAVAQSHIVGDVVGHYCRIGAGKLGVTFAVDIESARQLTEAYRAAGVPAELVTGETLPLVRAATLRRFRTREVLQLVNVDLFGEGFDLPGIEVVSFARPTCSYSLYAQQFGRALRPMPGKDRAIVLDHVGNVSRHGLPDLRNDWTLDRRERRSKGADTAPPVRVCPACTAVYERHLGACPACGHAPVPAGRSTPAEVEGVLAELDPAALAALRGEIDRVNGPAPVTGLSGVAALGAMAQHVRRRDAQGRLQAAIQTWGGWATLAGHDTPTMQRLFWVRFGVDVGTAQTLSRPDADALRDRVAADLADKNIACTV